MLSNKLYYTMKPFIPRSLQLILRRARTRRRLSRYRQVWPIDPKACEPPQKWAGWPGGKQFALILTHDVDNDAGQQRCYNLIKLEESLGFRSLFTFVPERYNVLRELQITLTENGFEIGVHGLEHDGKLYSSREIFQKRATRINHYLEEWDAVGFRSPSMHYNLDWIRELNIEYDLSTFDTDPFEPQPQGMGTIFPFWVDGDSTHQGYIEMPYTLAQDFTLFVIMKEKSIDIWKHKLDWIAKHGGMALLNTHPDYMNFTGRKLGLEEYLAEVYAEFLQYIKCRHKGEYWHVLPRDLARFWVKSMKSGESQVPKGQLKE